jgi:hypothetical protein
MSVHQNFTTTAGPSVSSPSQQTSTCGITSQGEVVSHCQAPTQSVSKRNSFDFVADMANAQTTQVTQAGSSNNLPAAKPVAPRCSTDQSVTSRAESPEVWVDIELQDFPSAFQLADTAASMPSSLPWYSPQKPGPVAWVDIELQDWPVASQLADTAASMPSSLPWYNTPTAVPVPTPPQRTCTAQSRAILSKVWGQAKKFAAEL